MYLKQLQAFGFKSFADRIVFDFESGITSIIGPNGCGKSNVVDAVKWVLGEQSAKSLRSSEMLDVLFNGSEYRKSLNFAEVTLTFDNSAGRLPIGAPEVSVTRRLYRNGDSEYLINKAVCRLRDVRELFWDTGIGTSSYSIIEQGRVAQLIEAGPKDRRSLFEEAAGIRKYKERKKAALRKLERVAQNIERLNDVTGEVEKRLRTVSRQADKALRAKNLQDKLRGIGLAVLLHEAAATEADLQQAGAELADAQKEYAALSKELTASQAETVQRQEEEAELDLRLGENSEKLSTARARLERLEAELEGGRRNVEELAREAKQAKEITQKAGEQAAALAAERERLELDAVQMKEAAEKRTREVEEKKAALQKAEEKRTAAATALAEIREEAMRRLGQRTRARESLTRAESELDGLDFRLRRARAQLDKAEGRLRLVRTEEEELREQTQIIAEKQQALTTERDHVRVLRRRAEEESDRLAEKARELHGELEHRCSRAVVLEDLRESGEGLSPGVRAVVTTLREDEKLFADVHGLVADCLGVDPRLEAAVEAVLGPYIEAVVVGREETAAEMARRLSERALGRAAFLSLTAAERRRAAVEEDRHRGVERFRGRPGFLGRLSEMVTCREQYRATAEVFLGDALLFADQASAAAAREEAETCGLRVTTLAGELYAPRGTFTGGREGARRLSPLARKNEIARLREEIADLEFQGEAWAEKAGAAEKAAHRAAADEERLESELRALTVTTAELKSRQTSAAREKSRGTEERSAAAAETTTLEAERTACAVRVAKLRTAVEETTRAEQETTAETPALAKRLAAAEKQLAAARDEYAVGQREAATFRERAAALERECVALSARFAERRDEAERERARVESARARQTELVREIAEKEKSRKSEAGTVQELHRGTEALRAAKEELRLQWENARGREREAAGALSRAQEQLSEVRIREAAARQRFESLLERGRKEFETDLPQELERRGGPPRITAEDREEAARLEERLRRLGPVNLYALEEKKELEERLSFLKEQAADLEAARNSLRDVIARINRRSRRLFQETFEKVRDNFREIFRKLFGGGRADLLLEEGEDILEAGIEIVARPPGKEPRSISLLSGGEKAMTTIALLFAVFRSRPAPFCILDEVDAPLDDANVDCFNALLREFMDRSQFVVITHNKRTMAQADVLYGVTMPEPGVSKRIAVKFEEIEKQIPNLDEDKAKRPTPRKTKPAETAAAKKSPEPAAVTS